MAKEEKHVLKWEEWVGCCLYLHHCRRLHNRRETLLLFMLLKYKEGCLGPGVLNHRIIRIPNLVRGENTETPVVISVQLVGGSDGVAQRQHVLEQYVARCVDVPSSHQPT